MWVFYMISLPLTVGMVAATLRYFAGPAVPAHVLAVVGYAWLCSLSFVVLVPTDIWMAISGNQKSDVGFFWSWSYWSTFILAWSVVPTLQGYEDSGDFTFKERLKTSIHKNMTYYAIVGSTGLFGLILIIIMRHDCEYMNCVMEALELEDTIRNYEQRGANGWIGMMLFYSLTPGQTSSVSLLMICSGALQRMGDIDDVVPFFGRTFNKIYPLIMVVYTLLVAGNFFEHLIDFFGGLKRFKCWTDLEEDTDGLDPSGIFILQKERNLMEQGRKGEATAEMNPERTTGGNVAHKYSSIRDQRSSSKPIVLRPETLKEISSTSINLEPGNSEELPSESTAPDSPGAAGTPSKWTSFRKFLRFGSSPSAGTNLSATESLDEIFRKLKRGSSNSDVDHLDYDGLP
nr:unnamed protein product [Digitaria exilis]